MNLQQIKDAIDAGKTVHWKSAAYTVLKDRLGQYHIVCSLNHSCIGLTWANGTTLNGKPEEFYTP